MESRTIQCLTFSSRSLVNDIKNDGLLKTSSTILFVESYSSGKLSPTVSDFSVLSWLSSLKRFPIDVTGRRRLGWSSYWGSFPRWPGYRWRSIDLHFIIRLGWAGVEFCHSFYVKDVVEKCVKCVAALFFNLGLSKYSDEDLDDGMHAGAFYNYMLTMSKNLFQIVATASSCNVEDTSAAVRHLNSVWKLEKRVVDEDDW